MKNKKHLNIDLIRQEKTEARKVFASLVYLARHHDTDIFSSYQIAGLVYPDNFKENYAKVVNALGLLVRKKYIKCEVRMKTKADLSSIDFSYKINHIPTKQVKVFYYSLTENGTDLASDTYI